MTELGYARVSTTHQDLERQLDALAGQGIPPERIWQDKKTGQPSTVPASPSCAATPAPATPSWPPTSTASGATCANA